MVLAPLPFLFQLKVFLDLCLYPPNPRLLFLQSVLFPETLQEMIGLPKSTLPFENKAGDACDFILFGLTFSLPSNPPTIRSIPGFVSFAFYWAFDLVGMGPLSSRSAYYLGLLRKYNDFELLRLRRFT